MTQYPAPRNMTDAELGAVDVDRNRYKAEPDYRDHINDVLQELLARMALRDDPAQAGALKRAQQKAITIAGKRTDARGVTRDEINQVLAEFELPPLASDEEVQEVLNYGRNPDADAAILMEIERLVAPVIDDKTTMGEAAERLGTNLEALWSQAAKNVGLLGEPN